MSQSAIDTSFSGPIVVDPVTRLEGHLRIEVEVTNGRISNAYSSGTLWRGIEQILIGRDPRDAQHLTQRTCGVCTYVHALASTRAVDDAVGVKIPPLAAMLRNLVLSALYLHDHIVHFYHLHALDFVDVSNCLNADAAKAAKIASDISPRKTSAEQMQTVKDRIKKYVDSGQLGHLTNAYFLGKHPAYVLSPELDLIATAHYLEALRLQVNAAKAMAVFGGKNPHPQFTVAGGVTSYDSLKPERIKEFLALEKEVCAFVNEVYIPDLLAIAAQYKDVAGYGGTTNFITFGEFRSDDDDLSSGFFKPGLLFNRDISTVQPFDPGKITEHVRHSWFNGAEARKPFEGVTDPNYTDLHGDGRYSWSKAPRYDDTPMETGPLAQMLVAYASGHEAVVPVVNKVLETLSVGPEALFSTLGRTAARGIQAAVVAGQMENWVAQFQDQIRKEAKPQIYQDWEMPNEAEGVGFVTAPRGGLSHWIRIKDKKIANFQLVVPTTWNMGPRDAKNQIGPFEEALIGVPIADPKRPVEILRTIHSFDPCIACAIHLIDPVSNELRVFQVL
ncbi:MAG: nickel-dependent hydrogenase large subunit [Deltaproteobacteria bacterium]|jgi:[NiFe] hydrogenase large subunit|nr:nickel-dependent hydrogenase large subunit [Deltaproteobacteria bacterium]